MTPIGDPMATRDTSGNPTLQDLADAIQRGQTAVEPTAEDFEVDDDEAAAP